MTDFTQLRTIVSGPVLTPDDAGFAEELVSNNREWVHTPQGVVGAASAADVAEAVRFAAANDLPVRILATGHGDEAAITTGLVITTRRLDQVVVDPATKTATFGAGVRWSTIVAAAAEHDLAAITGAAATVGAIGYLLGGGLGPLARSHGMSSDYVIGFTVVTAAGDIVEASAAENTELFWALRGGKGGLGVVTGASLRLVKLPDLFAGNMIFSDEHIEAVLAGWAAYTPTAPINVTTSIAIVRMPPLPELPPFLSGKTVAMVRFAYPGDPARGAELAAPLRALAPAVVDSIRPMRPIEVPSIHNDPTDPVAAALFGGLLDRIDENLVTALLDLAGAGKECALVSVELRHIGSAAAVDVVEGSAAGGRDASFTFAGVGILMQPGIEPAVRADGARLLDAVAPYLSPVTNINFATTAYLDPALFATCWSLADAARLANIRADLDPTGVFAFAPA
ncbi:MAG: mcrA [Subtercola sp.]|nr:mcrA [Subtercola sp.]